MSASSFAPYQPPREPRFGGFGTGGYQQLPDNTAGAGPSSSQAAAAGPSFNSSAYVNPGVIEQGADRINKYETSLPIRVDIEAALCYALGCLSGIVFLIFETKNDYVRFHAWQSCLTFVIVVAVQIFFSLFSSVMSWLIFAIELALIGWLGYNAYINGDSLDRYEVPYVGRIASQWVDSE
ncbi:hypothetical protein HK104_005137 [Borealophlyctis nickersoniae]|nr:hypothetical protein HK104_005137 [Borealophlyctis nickersoniae]